MASIVLRLLLLTVYLAGVTRLSVDYPQQTNSGTLFSFILDNKLKFWLTSKYTNLIRDNRFVLLKNNNFKVEFTFTHARHAFTQAIFDWSR